jgi:hypothetical protein
VLVRPFRRSPRRNTSRKSRDIGAHPRSTQPIFLRSSSTQAAWRELLRFGRKLDGALAIAGFAAFVEGTR